jgi:RNA polymerase sigma factor (sigma-70 family)
VYIDKDPELISKLLSSDSKTVNQALTAIYHHNFSQVRKFVLTNSGTDEDARDIFQEGMMIFYFNLLSRKFEQRSAISTYIFSICRNLWFQRLRKETTATVSPEESMMPSEETSEVNSSVLADLLKELKEECTQLLTSFYFNGKSIKDLMVEFSLGSKQAAKNKKLRCMEYLIRKIKEKKLSIENFYL